MILDIGSALRAELRMAIRSVRGVVLEGSVRVVCKTEERLAAGRAFRERMVEVQNVRRAEGWGAKVHNMRLAAGSIEDVVIAPGERFSFWKLVGRPSSGRGFERGRSIMGGEVRASYGGGLCQLAGIIHALALRAGLSITERHAHSIDLYDETTRFAPLGSDAAVAYGYKDLRLDNPLDVPVCFRFAIAAEHIRAALCAECSVDPWQVEHTIAESEATHTIVDTVRRGPRGEVERMGRCRYRRIQPEARQRSEAPRAREADMRART